MKLLPKLLLLIVPPAIFIIVIISYYSFSHTYSIIRGIIEEEQRKDVRETFDKIDRLLYERYNDIQTIAESRIFYNPSRSDEENLIAQRRLTALTGPWDKISIVDREGVVNFSTDESEVGENVMDEEYDSQVFHQALAGSVSYTDVYRRSEGDNPTMSFASPIWDEEDPSNPTIGVVVAHFAWPVVVEILENVAGQGGTVISIYNKEGVEIASSNGNLDNLLKRKITKNGLFESVINGQEATINEKSLYGDYEVVVSLVPDQGFLSYTGNDWVIRIETPTSVAYAPAARGAMTLLLVTIPLSFLGIGIIIIFAYYLLRSIEKITKTVEKFSAGDLTQRVDIRSSDEFGRLATAFNTMAAKLQESQQDLGQKITQRTIELETAKKTLEENLTEVKKINNLMIGRELKMIELKKEIERMKSQKEVANVEEKAP